MPSALELIGLPLSFGGMGILLFCILGVAVLAALARKEFRADLEQRRALLNQAAGLLDDAKLTVGSEVGEEEVFGADDGHGVVTARTNEG